MTSSVREHIARPRVGANLVWRLRAGQGDRKPWLGNDPSQGKLGRRTGELRCKFAYTLRKSEITRKVLLGKVFAVMPIVVCGRQMLRMDFPLSTPFPRGEYAMIPT